MNTKQEKQNQNAFWDVIVIGGGVVGCAVFRRFCLAGASVLLLEKGGDILSGASKANSALLHTGFDAPPGSLELACMQQGYQEFIAIREQLNLPLLKTGALVVAWNKEQLDKLPGIVEQAHQNNVMDVIQITPEELYRREPHLSASALGAVAVPGESVIDPWSTPLAYLTQGVKMGGEYRFHCEVNGATPLPEGWRIQTTKGDFKSRIVINCAGNQGDDVERFCQPPDFTIKPRKGQFLVYDKAAADQINAIILPVPTAITKGVLLAKTIFGNLLLGPTAEEQQDKEQAAVNELVMTRLIEQGEKLLPALRNFEITATYAGLRPATEKKEYRIHCNADKRWITVAGIRSTGLTAALGIARHTEQLCRQQLPDLLSAGPRPEPVWPKMPMLSAYEERDYCHAQHQGIVCHCEMVTQREIEAALASDVPPECLGGLRRRTRAMMGRCNGFYCSHRIAEIIDSRFDNPLLTGKIK